MIRSDVGIALKKNVQDGLSAETQNFLEEWAETVLVADEGVLFYAADVKWPNFDVDGPVLKLYDELAEFEEDDFLVLEGCHDYPDSTEGNAGSWVENPWNLVRYVTVRVDYCV